MTPSHYPDEGNVTRLTPEEAARRFEAVPELERRERTEQERHREDARVKALEQAQAAAEALAESIGWAQSIGVEIPLKVRATETKLSQWVTVLEDEER